MLCIEAVEGVLGIDEGGDATCFLGLCDGMDGQGGLTRRLRTIDLDDASLGIASHAEGGVQSDTACGDDFHILYLFFAHSHDATLAEVLLYLRHGSLQRLQFLFLRA